ncbi:nucleolar protein dao-5 isoform X2 [Tribolium castaneum]|uniref:nucleolar protein dao-5 isoform X2 n=1 Tax=Tribolium castaneum TaxID=7070 RepID=UPI00077D97F1|nr:PREDICTED: uncharacterized protein LOC103312518 isoform X2 [Tribolium castaneum]|eukprot:XP_015834671.1 PREDICTED: uncharacterized protein LOC103312518 isoform X2 [Tribolium castaneum]
MSVPGSTSGVNSRRQKRMGPAPFASFEDLSDELESPEDKNPAGSVVRLPGIREDATPIDHPGISLLGAMPLSSPQKLTPRIDISRASSSSHHDSRDSTPERELFDHEAPKLGLGFREEGALDLRSSTEELDFQDPQEVKKKPTKPQSPEEISHHQRKDSQSSEIGLLCISGRTSRLSSIGSQGSGHSRLSNASHLSVISNQSGLSRSPSPHKMLLETSFCGTKPPENAPNNKSQTGTKIETEVLEKVLLARKHDPTQAVLAEGIAVPPPKPKRVLQKSDITIKVDEPSNNNIPRKFIAKSGVEYIYIPLKGPLPSQPETTTTNTKPKLREVKSATIQPKTKTPTKPKPKSASPSPKREDEPKYIRIKLKPDHMYSNSQEEESKPETLDLQPEPKPIESPKPSTATPSPSLSRKSSFASLFRSKETIISPESPTGCKRKSLGGILSESLKERSRSKSRERDLSNESIGKQKSVFSRFRKKKDETTSSSEVLPNFDAIAKVEFKFNDNRHELESDSVRIPLHSPTFYEDRTIVTSSQDSQETVIEVNRTEMEVQVESNITVNGGGGAKSEPQRQSSTSSENVVFSTKLGSNNEIFSTKLPKDKAKEPEISSAPEDVSSESERDSEAELPKKKDLKLELDYVEPERKELVLQDSYDDELPYVPTTLPQERSAALPIIPIKQRSTFEMKTHPIERPRSTTPINPSCLEEYCEDVMTTINTIEKLKISLPRNESVEKTVKSPRKPISNTTNWFEFAEKGINTGRRSSLTQDETPPPLPPKGVQKEWINFEEIPERRKPPKRIQTLPSRGHIEVSESVLQDNVVYNYVNPEECKCECHEMRERKKGCGGVQEDELPLLDDEQEEKEGERLKLDVAVADRRSIVSDSSVDLSAAVEPPEANGSVKLRTPFTSDLGVSSNRSSIVSQDEPESPDSGSPNAFPKPLLG